MAHLQPLPQNRAPLQPAAFLTLPTGAVRPRGWLLDQLRLQADGVTGHLDEYWPDVGRGSAWLGGPGDDWERAPYYCDGLVPLAYILDDPVLVAKSARYISWLLNSQKPSGAFGTQNPDWWPRMVALKVLQSYYEASGDPRVLELMTAYCHYMDDMLDSMPLYVWAAARGSDNLLVVHWLYNLTGDARLLDLAEKIRRQTMDWPALQGAYGVEKALPHRQYRGNMGTHVVNNAQGIKTGAAWYAQTGDRRHARAALESIETLMRHHGQPNGIWSGDEHLHGTAPTAGTELCAVVEYMYSLEEMQRILGEPALGDRLERVAYNALPATFKPDMWAHQYDQQVNQVLCTVAKRGWTDNNDESNIYGQTPNFGCCQANLHQGWPKLVRSMVMALPHDEQNPGGGLAVTAWGPCAARALLPGGGAALEIETGYPFEGEAVLRLGLEKSAAFTLALRIPGWAEGTEIRAGGETHHPHAGAFFHLQRAWEDGDEVRVRFPMRVRVETGHRGLVSVYRGPLLFGLQIGERWVQVGGELPHADWEVYPTTPWNYGLQIDPQDPEAAFTVETSPAGSPPFEPSLAPVRLSVAARRIPWWRLEDNSAGEIDGGPHQSGEALETVTLIPYGATNLRVAAFPIVK